MDKKRKKRYEKEVSEMKDDTLYETYVDLKSKLGGYGDNHIDKENPRPTGFCCFCKNGKNFDKGKFGDFVSCLKCGEWDHEYCSGIDQTAEYICPVCDPTKHKNAPGFKLRARKLLPNDKKGVGNKVPKSRKKKNKKKSRYSEDQEYNPLESPIRKRKLDLDEDMVVQQSPKRRKKTKQKKKSITPIKQEGIVSQFSQIGDHYESTYLSVEKWGSEEKNNSSSSESESEDNKKLHGHGDEDSSIEMENLISIHSDSEMKKLFDEIIKNEVKLTKLQCNRKHKKSLNKQKGKTKQAQKKLAEAEGKIDYLKKEKERADKRVENYKDKMAKLIDTHKKNVDKYVKQKNAISTENRKLKEQVEDHYQERDLQHMQKLTYDSNLKMLENRHNVEIKNMRIRIQELQRKNKYYESKYPEENVDDRFDSVSIHVEDGADLEVFSPNVKSKKKIGKEWLMNDNSAENHDSFSFTRDSNNSISPLKMKKQSGIIEERIGNDFSSSAIPTATPSPTTPTKTPSPKKKISYRGKPNVGKKKKKKKDIPKTAVKKKRRITVTPVNGIDDFVIASEFGGNEMEKQHQNSIKCELCEGVQNDGMLICEICQEKAVHESCMGEKDRRKFPDIEKWRCNICQQSSY